MRKRALEAAALDLVNKLEGFADQADGAINELRRNLGATGQIEADVIELNRLIERATNYSHAATLTRRLLEVSP